MVAYSEIQKQLEENNLPKGTYGIQIGDFNPETDQMTWGGGQWDFYTDKETAQAIADAWREESVGRTRKIFLEEPNHSLVKMWDKPQNPEDIAPHYRVVNFSQYPSRKESIQSQLSQRYPELKEGVLYTIEKYQVPEGNGSSINDTSSDVVLPIKMNGKKAFAKVHSKKILDPEAYALKIANQYPETRVITPSLIDYLHDDKKGVLLTYDTQQQGIISRQDRDTYLSLRSKIFKAFSYQHKKNPEELISPIYTDVFNATLLQAFLRPHANEQIFTQASERLVLPFEELKSRLTRREDLQRLQKHQKTYENNQSRLSELPLSPQTVIIDDLKPQNVFPGILRPRGDFGEVKTGSPEYALARIEQACNSDYAAFAAFARNKIEDHIQEHYSNNGLSGYNFRYSPQGITSMQEAVKVLSPIAAARLLSFSLKQGLQETATRYEEAINRYQSQL